MPLGAQTLPSALGAQASRLQKLPTPLCLWPSRPTLVSELAVACFDAESGFVEIYKGRSYPEQRSEAEQRANLLTIRYVPGHYQALVSTAGHAQPTLRELLAGLEARGVLHVVTDG